MPSDTIVYMCTPPEKQTEGIRVIGLLVRKGVVYLHGKSDLNFKSLTTKQCGCGSESSVFWPEAGEIGDDGLSFIIRSSNVAVSI